MNFIMNLQFSQKSSRLWFMRFVTIPIYDPPMTFHMDFRDLWNLPFKLFLQDLPPPHFAGFRELLPAKRREGRFPRKGDVPPLPFFWSWGTLAESKEWRSQISGPSIANLTKQIISINREVREGSWVLEPHKPQSSMNFPVWAHIY